jgi:hypothetical protein
MVSPYRLFPLASLLTGDCIRFNFVSHPHHGTDPEKYKAKSELGDN